MENRLLGMDGIRNYENEAEDEIIEHANDVDENVRDFNHAMTSNRSTFSARQQSFSQLISNVTNTLEQILSRSAFKPDSGLEDEVDDGGDDDGGGTSINANEVEEYEQVQVENDEDESEDQLLLQKDTARIKKFDDVSHGGTTLINSKAIREEGVLFPPNQPQNESTEGSHEDEENDSSASLYNSQRSPTSILVTEPGEGDEALDDNSDLEQNDNFQNLTTGNGKELEGTKSFSNPQSSTHTTVTYIPTPPPQLPLLETLVHIAAEERRPTLAPTSYGVEREKSSLQHQKMGKRKVEKISSSLPPRKRIATTTCNYTTTIFKRVSRPILYSYRCTHCPAFFRRPQRIQSHSNLHLPSAYAEICRVNNCGWYVVPGEMARHYKQQHPGLQKRGERVISKRHGFIVTRESHLEISQRQRVIDGSPNIAPPHHPSSVGQLPFLLPPCPPNGCGVAISEPNLAASVMLEESETRMEQVLTPTFSYAGDIQNHNGSGSSASPVVNSAQNNSMLERSDDVNKLSTLEVPKHSERLRQKLSTEDLPPAAKKIVKTRTIPSSDGHSSRNPLSSKDKPTYTKRPSGRSNYLHCNKCPAWEIKVERIKEHLLLHHEGSLSIPCADCGWTVLPQQLESHRSRIHSDSTPDYTVHKRPSYLKFECKQCPATVTTVQLINTHLMLHRPDSKAQICKVQNCGWLVDPDKMNRHFFFYHPEERLKCTKCPAKFGRCLKMKKHQLLHKRGEGVDCEKCGWRVRDLSHHNSRWHSVGEGENENEGG